MSFRIEKDKIGDMPIRLQFNQDELWTKALKYLLIDIKWIMAFASNVDVAADESDSDTSSSGLE